MYMFVSITTVIVNYIYLYDLHIRNYLHEKQFDLEKLEIKYLRSMDGHSGFQIIISEGEKTCMVIFR